MLTQESFDRLLGSFDSDREIAGAKYQQIHSDLIRFFEWRGCPFPDQHADETLNRVAKKVFAGEEIRDLKKYSFGVARLLYLEIQKASARERQALRDLPELNTSRNEEHELRLDCLRLCLKGLTADQVDLIFNYYRGEKSEKIKHRKTLASRLQISLNTLRMRALRLREKLEACVEECLSV